MFAVLSAARKPLARMAVLLSALWLAACQPVTTAGGGPSIDTGAPVAVALLVPSASDQAGDVVLSKSLENAARLAISDLNGVKIDLRVYPTSADPAAAAAAATHAADEGAKIILGPVYAQAANAAGLAVASRGINVLSFSNNVDIAGRNVFVLGPTFQNTASRLVAYAASQGKRNIMIVQDDTPAGAIGAKAITDAALTAGSNIAGVQKYEFSQQGVVNAIPGIATAIKSAGADSVFFTANTAGALPYATQLLKENGVDPAVTQFIGLTRWDIPASTLSLPGVQNGWFALPDPALTAQFNSRYSAAFGEPPHPIAGLAYDGIAAIGALIKAGDANALTAASLTQAAGFVGVNGIFRLNRNGTNERGLAVGQIRNNQVVVIDPAPRSFGGAGF